MMKLVAVLRGCLGDVCLSVDVKSSSLSSDNETHDQQHTHDDIDDGDDK